MADTPRTIRMHIDFRGTEGEYLELIRRQVREESKRSAQIHRALLMPPGWPDYCSPDYCPLEYCDHRRPGLWRLLWYRLRGRSI